VADHRRVITSNGDPLGAILKTKRDRKRIAKYQDPMMPAGMSSYISPPGHRVAYYIAPPSQPPMEGCTRENLSKANQQRRKKRLRSETQAQS
jgi:hypothetical protein